VTTHLLDTTVLVDYVRERPAARHLLIALLAQGDDVATTCVSIAELERGIRARERKVAETLVERLSFLPTTREAAMRAGRYLAQFSARGVTLHLADALIAGTARAHGAVLVTHNVEDFPMRDIRILLAP
jgi:predicted nucleic acid-binding protein